MQVRATKRQKCMRTNTYAHTSSACYTMARARGGGERKCKTRERSGASTRTNARTDTGQTLSTSLFSSDRSTEGMSSMAMHRARPRRAIVALRSATCRNPGNALAFSGACFKRCCLGEQRCSPRRESHQLVETKKQGDAEANGEGEETAGLTRKAQCAER